MSSTSGPTFPENEDLDALHHALLGPAAKVLEYVRIFRERFGRVPDERGLTDRLIFELYDTSRWSTQVKDPKGSGTFTITNLGINTEFTGGTESQNGADYILRFALKNYQTGTLENREVWIQAKTWKNGVAQFVQTVGKTKEYQFQLLAKAIQEKQRANVVVYGGYLVYGASEIGAGAKFVDGIDYFPIDVVLAKAVASDFSQAAINSELWKLRGTDPKYTLQGLLDGPTSSSKGVHDTSSWTPPWVSPSSSGMK